jgi:hypothetical protein
MEGCWPFPITIPPLKGDGRSAFWDVFAKRKIVICAEYASFFPRQSQ